MPQALRQAAADPVDLRMTRWMATFFDDLGALVRPELLGPGFDMLAYLDAERERLHGLSTLSRVLHANSCAHAVRPGGDGC